MLNEIQVTFVHPVNGEVLAASLDPNLTVDGIYDALISERFIAPLAECERFMLAISGKGKIIGNQTLDSIGATDGSVVPKLKNEGIKKSNTNIKIQKNSSFLYFI